MDSAKDMLIRKWYDTMKPHVEDCVKKNDNVLLRADIDILDKLDIKVKWSDPDFDDASKDVMWEYLNTLNYLACLYVESSPEEVQGLHAAASRLAESAEFALSEDGKMSFNIRAFQSLITDQSKQGDIATLMASAGPLMQTLMGGAGAEGGAPSGLHSFLQAQMGNFASLLGSAEGHE
jgi:hypothetical protein